MNTKLIAVVFVLMLSLTGLFAFAVNNYNPVTNIQSQKVMKSTLFPNGTLVYILNNQTYYIHERKSNITNNVNNIMDDTTSIYEAIIFFTPIDSSVWKPYFNTLPSNGKNYTSNGNDYYGLMVNIYAVNTFGNKSYLGYQIMDIYPNFYNSFETILNYNPNIQQIEYSISYANIYYVNNSVQENQNTTQAIPVNNVTGSVTSYLQPIIPNTEYGTNYVLDDTPDINVYIYYPIEHKYYITFTNSIISTYKIDINNKIYSTTSHNITVLLANGTYNIEIIYNSTDTYYGQFIVSGQDQTINLLNLSIYNSKSFATILYLVIVVLALIMILKSSYISLTFFTIGGIMMEYFGYLMGISYFTIDTILLSIVIIASVFVYRVMLE